MERWEPLNAEFTCGTVPGRNADLYVRVMEQFQVLSSPRYQSGGGMTFCNIFVQDTLNAMSVQPGHWWMGEELSANGMGRWFRSNGKKYGWNRVDVDHARASANAGRPTVAVWENAGGIGHVAMVMPSPDQGPLHIAQAGKHNLWDAEIEDGFGEFAPMVVYYSHP